MDVSNKNELGLDFFQEVLSYGFLGTSMYVLFPDSPPESLTILGLVKGVLDQGYDYFKDEGWYANITLKIIKLELFVVSFPLTGALTFEGTLNVTSLANLVYTVATCSLFLNKKFLEHIVSLFTQNTSSKLFNGRFVFQILCYSLILLTFFGVSSNLALIGVPILTLWILSKKVIGNYLGNQIPKEVFTRENFLETVKYYWNKGQTLFVFMLYGVYVLNCVINVFSFFCDQEEILTKVYTILFLFIGVEALLIFWLLFYQESKEENSFNETVKEIMGV